MRALEAKRDGGCTSHNQGLGFWVDSPCLARQKVSDEDASKVVPGRVERAGEVFHHVTPRLTEGDQVSADVPQPPKAERRR